MRPVSRRPPSGETVLVVGGTRGTGLRIAHLLVQRGVRVRALARDPEQAVAVLGREVEVLPGDVTIPSTLSPAVRGVTHIVHAAGVRSGRPAWERLVRDTDYQGVVHVLGAARDEGFSGRFLYLTSIGGLTPSVSATLLNLFKGNVLTWRRRAEERIRASGLDYTIVRAGILLGSKGGRRGVAVSQGDLPLAPRHRITRDDAAEVCVEALRHAGASRTTIEIVEGGGRRTGPWDGALGRLVPDPEPS